MPLCWEGCAVLIAFVFGMAMLPLVADLTRRALAGILLFAAFGAVVILTWDYEAMEDRPSWREMLFSWQTLVAVLIFAVLVAAMIAAGFYGYHPRVPHPRAFG
jgi:hypothetical protein